MNESGLMPLEFNVVVKIDAIEDKIGSIFIPTSAKERENLAVEEGTLVAVSPHAFTYAEWPEGACPPEVGAKVLIARYAGVLRERDGKQFRIVKDRDIVAVVETPTLLPRQEKMLRHSIPTQGIATAA